LSAVDALLVRDARRGPDGTLGTAPPFAAEAPLYLPPGDVVPGVPVATAGGPRPVVRVGGVSAALVNGVFGDPLLHVRVRHERRSLLFDLGDAVRLPARLAHQVTDVFLSHAHADHVAGFLWLVRSRIGDFPPCRVYGPPGIAGHAEGFVRGLLWDRAGVRAPRFQVCELAGERLREWRVEAGDPGPHPLGERGAPGGVLLEEAAFRVRASTLDHAGTPVLAFAFEPALEIHVRKDRLEALGVPPGPWLGALKRHVAAGEEEVPVRLPDGSVRSAGALAEALVLVAPGETLVYATDLADTAGNRTRLTALARGAHTLFCEAAFLEADAAQAARTGHLTTRACAEIAAAAGVGRLVPFHFSRRYETEPGRPYAEVRAVFPRVAIPSGAEEAGRSLS
jgi:ribonuclease BN (tRNA processing enzyme)